MDKTKKMVLVACIISAIAAVVTLVNMIVSGFEAFQVSIFAVLLAVVVVNFVVLNTLNKKK